MVLPLNQSFIISQQMFKLHHRCNLWVLIFTLVNFIVSIEDTSVIFSVENLQLIDLFVNTKHKFTQALEVDFEFLDYVFSILVESSVEQFFPNRFNLMTDFFLSFWFWMSEFRFKPLCVDVVL